ncbi:MAG: FecR domain-containing protein [Kiritimatiellae bacterium]|nr:FecR domain-containing protein [Kiritimatiellia bacterium]
MSEDLFEKYFLGTLDPGETEELKRVLRGGEAGRRAFTDFLQERSLLVRVCGEATVAATAGAEAEAHPSRTAIRPAARAPIKVRTDRTRASGPRLAPAARDIRPRGWWITAWAAAILVMLGMLIEGQFGFVRLRDIPRAPVAVLQSAGGTVLAISRAGLSRAVTPGHAFAAGDRVQTRGAEAYAVVLCAEWARLRLEADAELVLAPPAPGAAPAGRALEVALPAGVLKADVPKAESRRLRITTPHAEITVVGTRFSVAVAARATRTEMDEGTVRVRNLRTHESFDLHEGYYALVGESSVVAARYVVPSPPPAEPVPVPVEKPAAGLLALYTFEEGRGTTIHDRSGADPPLDLTLDSPRAVRWLPGGGLTLVSPVLIVSPTPARTIISACRETDEITIEAWVKPWRARVEAELGRLVGVSADPYHHNFMLAQGHDTGRGGSAIYDFRLRTPVSDPVGKPGLMSPDGSLRAEVTYVVCVGDAAGNRRIYLNGTQVASDRRGGDFAGWDPAYHLVMGNEYTRDRPWRGTYYRVAIHNRALSPEEIHQNYAAFTPRTAQDTSADKLFDRLAR